MIVERVLSGMRPTGPIHLGHYYGVLRNWLRLQNEFQCFFCIADLHALTTYYQQKNSRICDNVKSLVVDWLSVGIDPSHAVIFLQSDVHEHLDLYFLLSVITPLSWLERVPTYKDQLENLSSELATYGFLGYPLLQAADILIYRANYVPIGEDQLPHIELTREVARRFNHMFGQELDFETHAHHAAKKMGSSRYNLYISLRDLFQEEGDQEALESARCLVMEQKYLSVIDRERLLGYLDGCSRQILTEPQSLLTDNACLPGLDGRKMSKSYANSILLREEPEKVTYKISRMMTDPARKRRSDPGDPDKCPVFVWHKVYSSAEVIADCADSCRSARIGCLDCKKLLSEVVIEMQVPIRERAQYYLDDPGLIRDVLNSGAEIARQVVRDTMRDVRDVMSLK